MFNTTDCVHRVPIFFFTFQSPLLGFSINGYGTCSSFLLVLLKQVQKNTTKSCFQLLCTQFSKEALNRGLMGRDPFLKSKPLFYLITLSHSPLRYCQF